MWIQEKYKGVKKFTRKGKLASLSLPKDAKLSQSSYELNIKAKSMDFIKGKDTYILTDEIGIADDVELTFFFNIEGLCIKLNKGTLYVKEADGTVSSVSMKNKIQTSTLKADKITWKTVDDLIVFANYVIKSKYNLISEMDVRQYRSNLLFTMKTSFEPAQGNLFTVRFTKISEEIGGSFNFDVKEKIEKPVVTSYIDPKENNLYEDKVGKHSKHSNDYDDSFEDGYDDSEDTDELTSSMHEIDIFNDYVPLDD